MTDKDNTGKVKFNQLISGVVSDDDGHNPYSTQGDAVQEAANELDLGGGNIFNTEIVSDHPRRYP